MVDYSHGKITGYRFVPEGHSSPMGFMPKGQNKNGYGRRILSGHQIQIDGRWHKVFTALFGNSGVLWIRQANKDRVLSREHENQLEDMASAKR